MPTQKLVQNNFTSGQYDRTAQGKEGSALVANGFAKGLNVLSGDGAEVFKRLGTKFLFKTPAQSVMVPFRLPDGNDIVLLCTEKKIKPYQYNNGELTEFLTPDDKAPSFPITGWNSATNGNYTVAVENTVTGTNPGAGFNLVGSPYYGKGTNVDFGRSTTNKSTYISINSQDAQLLRSLQIRWCLTCSGNHTGHYKGWTNPILQYSDDGSQWISVETQSKNPSTVGDSDAYRGSYHYGLNSDEKTENYVMCAITNVSHTQAHKYWRVLFLDKISNNWTFGGERLDLFVSNVTYASSAYTAVEFDTEFTLDVLKKIKYDQQNTMMIMCAEGVSPIQIDYNSGVLEKKAFTAVDTFGKPSCCCFFQNRLWFGGFDSMPTSVLASKFGVYDNFTVQTTVQFDDYLNLKCNQLKSKITNITGGNKVLYCFSEDGISFVDGGSGGLVATNQNIEFILRNKMPAGDSTPAVKDDVLLYASSNGVNLYSVDFDLLVDRFQVTDLAKYAKDVVNSKIDELHYVNDGGKLVYGLLENQSMFALLYEKNTLQGFFSLNIQNGSIYDICAIKNGRDYKLLMMVNRSGNWFIEEFVNTKDYANTNTPLLTKEDKKWATYDNMDKNIALDCHKRYDMRIKVTGTYTDEALILGSSFDLSKYIGQTLMLGQINGKDFAIVTLHSGTGQIFDITVESRRGNSNYFDVIYPEFTRIPIHLPERTNIGVISEGRYIGEYQENELSVENNLYGWRNGEDIVYTLWPEAKQGDRLYDADNKQITKYYENTVASVSDNAININTESRRVESGLNLYCWKYGNDLVYTASANPAVGDVLYNAAGAPITKYYRNVVDSKSGNNIGVWTTNVNIPAKYAWTNGNNTIYTSSANFEPGQNVSVIDGGNATVGGGDSHVDTLVYNGEVLVRNPNNDGTYNILYRGYLKPTECVAFVRQSDAISRMPILSIKIYYVPKDQVLNPELAYVSVYSHPSGQSDQSIITREGSAVANRVTNPLYLSYNGINYTRNANGDVPATTQKTTVNFARYSDGDLTVQVSYELITKSFARDESYDRIDGNTYITLDRPVHKAIYGAIYDSYVYLKIEKPYESMKTIRQIDLAVIDTAHLEVGTCADDMQELENINDSSFNDLTNITLNGTFRIVPSDTPEWEKNIILRSNKGLPFTVNAVEIFVNYSNMGGN